MLKRIDFYIMKKFLGTYVLKLSDRFGILKMILETGKYALFSYTDMERKFDTNG